VKKFLLEQMTRRRFREIVERLWLGLFLIPRLAKADCCPNVYVDCTVWVSANCSASCGCYDAWGFFAADDQNQPACAPRGTGTCCWCASEGGCSACDAFQITCTGFCCGIMTYYNGNLCCYDQACCPC
jgi:hypothetical protein